MICRIDHDCFETRSHFVKYWKIIGVVVLTWLFCYWQICAPFRHIFILLSNQMCTHLLTKTRSICNVGYGLTITTVERSLIGYANFFTLTLDAWINVGEIARNHDSSWTFCQTIFCGWFYHGSFITPHAVDHPSWFDNFYFVAIAWTI